MTLLPPAVYRLWRYLGYAIGALIPGSTADALGLDKAIWLVAARMRETNRRAVSYPVVIQPQER